MAAALHRLQRLQTRAALELAPGTLLCQADVTEVLGTRPESCSVPDCAAGYGRRQMAPWWAWLDAWREEHGIQAGKQDKPAPWPSEPDTYLYVLRFGGLIKAGISTDAWQRRDAVAPGAHVHLEVPFDSRYDALRMERQIHQALRPRWWMSDKARCIGLGGHSEWFDAEALQIACDMATAGALP